MTDAEDTTDNARATGIAVSEEELAVLARVAGLRIAEERLPGLARDLTVTLRLATELDAVLKGRPVPVVRPFDPAWPGDKGGGR